MKKTIMIGTLVGVLAVGGVAMAGGPHGGGGFFGGRIARLMERLNLTEQQQLKAIQIRSAIKERRKDAKGSRGADMELIAAELAKPNPDKAKLHALADQRIAEMQKNMHFTIDQFLELHGTLTAEQRTQLVESLKKGKKHKKHHGDDE